MSYTRYHDGSLRASKDPWRIVRTALRKGTIVKPELCSRCGNKAKRLEAHHHDYSKPLEVEWLCTPCHTLIRPTTILSNEQVNEIRLRYAEPRRPSQRALAKEYGVSQAHIYMIVNRKRRIK